MSVDYKTRLKIFLKALNHCVVHRSSLKKYLLLSKIGEGGQASVLKV